MWLYNDNDEYYADVFRTRSNMSEKTKKFFPSISHAIIAVAPSMDYVKDKGIVASATLCMGSDDDAIAQLLLVAKDKETNWRTPYVDVQRGDKTVKLPVFKGALADELVVWGGRAWDAIKKKVGKPDWGHIYRVDSEGVKDITPKKEGNA